MANAREGLRRQRGAVAVMVGLALVVLIGMLGLVIDLGHLFVVKTELQNACDACALAAAKELTGVQSTQLHVAENAGITTAGRNNVDFQAAAVQPAPQNITFSATLNGGYQTRSSVEAGGTAQILSMKYARCSLERPDIPLHFMQVMGFGPKPVSATAVASLKPSLTNCAIPISMCRQSPAPATCDGGGVPDRFGLCVGQWYDGTFENQGGHPQENFNSVDFTPPSGGADEFTHLIEGAGQCNINISNPISRAPVSGEAVRAWNSRFGLYKNGGGHPDLASSPPDFTGYAYTPTNWPTRRNALADFRLKRSQHASYGQSTDTVQAGNDITGLPIDHNYRVATHGAGGELASAGADRRLVATPITNCDGLTGSSTVPILGWACVLLLHPVEGTGGTVRVEYLGSATAAGSPCATTGLPAGASAGGPLVPTLVQ